MTAVPYPPRHAARPRPHRAEAPPRCTPSSLSGCRGDRVHVASCPHGEQRQDVALPAPSALVFVGSTCVSRSEWDRALRLCVSKFGDPLYQTDKVFAELLTSPLGEQMVWAAA